MTKSPQHANRIQQAQKQQLKTGTQENLPIPVPDPGEIDWPSLVDTATRAMLNNLDKKGVDLAHWVDNINEQLEQMEMESK